MWILPFLITKVASQHLLFTEFTSQNCDLPPSIIRVIENYEKLDVSLPWTDMLYSITSTYYLGECGYAFTPNCCYSSTNPTATGNIGSAFLVELSNIDDYTSFLPQAANRNKYLKIKEINSTLFGNVFETYALCDGNCIDGAIRCYPNQTVNFYTDSTCDVPSELANLGPDVSVHSGQLGNFNLQFQLIENAYFKQIFKTWVNYDNWGIESSPLGHAIFLASMISSMLLTVILFYGNCKNLLVKRSFYTIGNFALLFLWIIYVILYTISMYTLDYQVYLVCNSLVFIFYSLGVYISGLISAKMFLQFAILPYLGGQKTSTVKICVYVSLTFVHFLTCWPQYLHFIDTYNFGDESFDRAYSDWYRFFDVWVYIVLILNGVISSLWVAILQSAQLTKAESCESTGKYSILRAFKILMLNDAGFLYIFLGQLSLLLSYVAISYSLIHIELTMDFFANDAMYDGFYAIETLILTCHYALVDACVFRMKKVFGKSKKSKEKESKEARKKDPQVRVQVIGYEEDKSTVQLPDSQCLPRTTIPQNHTIHGL